jgi:Leucine-rich repeat (LRR) protein
MTDLERIKELEAAFRFPLRCAALENLFTEKSFLTTTTLYTLEYMQSPAFPYKGVRNYSLDENGNVTGLALDFSPLFLLPDDYLRHFRHLQRLKLKHTFLRDVSVLRELPGLTTLYLSYSKLSDVSALRGLKTLATLNLRGNPQLDIPAEILDDWQDARKILNYLTKADRPINEAKIVVIGEANVGKTCLIERLLEGTFSPARKPTHGIQIKPWKIAVNNQNLKLNLWDFGGQRIAPGSWLVALNLSGDKLGGGKSSRCAVGRVTFDYTQLGGAKPAKFRFPGHLCYAALYQLLTLRSLVISACRQRRPTI